MLRMMRSREWNDDVDNDDVDEEEEGNDVEEDDVEEEGRSQDRDTHFCVSLHNRHAHGHVTSHKSIFYAKLYSIKLETQRKPNSHRTFSASLRSRNAQEQF